MGARVEWGALGGHAARHAVGVAMLLLGGHHPLLALVGALALYLAAFGFTHDLAHGALRLPRRLNEWALSFAAMPMLVSGHGMRLLHLRHHARPLADDDVEGAGARLPLWRAVLVGPMNAAQYRVEAFRAAGRRERQWMAGESGVAVLLAVAALVGGGVVGAAWVLVNVAMQLSASAWASHLPHRPPAVLVAVARKLAWSHSAVVASFLHHERHHRFPSIPCGQLQG